MKLGTKICAGALTLCLIGGGAYALADYTNQPTVDPAERTLDLDQEANTDDLELAPERLPSTLLAWGTIGEQGEGWLVLENENALNQQIHLNISEQTLILDAVTGDPLSFADLQENETIYVYHNLAMTMSLPPQTHAALILAHIPADFGVPGYFEIESVEVLEDGSVLMTTDRQENLTITDDCNLFPYLTKNIVLKEMLQPGDRILAWRNFVAESYPSQATPYQVMVFPYAYSGLISTNGETLMIDNEALPPAEDEALFEQEEYLMIPLARAAAASGCVVSLDETTNEIIVLQGDLELYRFHSDSPEVTKGEQDYYLAQPLTEKDGVLFIAFADFVQLHNLKVVEFK